MAIHFFTALRVAPGREFTESEACAANQVLSGVLLRGQFDVRDAPSADDLQVISRLMFLEQAGIISQRLVHDLHHWSQTPDADMPHDVQADAQDMAQLARDVFLNGVHQVRHAGHATGTATHTTRDGRHSCQCARGTRSQSPAVAIRRWQCACSPGKRASGPARRLGFNTHACGMTALY